MEDCGVHVSLRDTLARWSRPLAAFVTLTVLAAVAYLVLADKQYDARAKLQIVPVAAGETTFAGFSLMREGRDEEAPAQTAAQLVESSGVVDAVAIRLSADRDELLRAVAVKAEGTSNVVTVRARWSERRRAAQVANAFAGEFVSQQSSRFQAELMRTIDRLRERLRNVPASRRDESPARELAARLATLRTYVGQPDPTVEVVSNAVAPERHSWPRVLPVLLGALALSGLVSLFAVLMLAVLSPRPRPSLPPPEAEPARVVAPPEPAAEPELEPEPIPTVAEPEPVAGPTPAPAVGGGIWTLTRLEHLVEERGAEFPERVEEWRTYLFFLREHATTEGELPASFDALVEDVFGEVL